MPTTDYVSVLVSGGAVGSCYALLCVGYTINARVQRFFDVSQGAAVTTAAFVGWHISALGLPLGAVLVGAILAGAGAATLFCAARLLFTSPDLTPLRQFLGALGYLIATEGIIGLAEGGELRIYGGTRGLIHVGRVPLTVSDVVTIASSMVTVCTVAIVMRETQIGRQLKAVGSSPLLARISGLRVSRIQLFAALIGGAISGAAGFAYSWPRTVYPTIGLNVIVAPLAISILTPRYSWLMLGLISIMYGVMEALVFRLLPGEWKQTFVFGILIAVLVFSSRDMRGPLGVRKA